MTMIEAIRDAHTVAMESDDRVVVFGEDVGYFGGVFRCTQGLQERFGDHRCFDAPINESGIVGAAIGMAAHGLRPCVEIQFADYMYPAYDQIVSEAARLRHRSAGDFTAPLVVRMPTGGGIYGGQTHSQSPEALFTHVAGLTTVVVSNPYDAKGLLIASIEDEDPVVFLEPKRLYNGPFDGHHDRPIVPWTQHPLGEVPEGFYSIDLGTARVHREGSELTVLTYGTLVHVAQAAAEEQDLDVEIIDLRTLVPLDVETIVESVRKTGRCLVLHEATLTSGFGAELSATIQERCFYHLEAPIIRVGHSVSARARVVVLPRSRPGRRCDAEGRDDVSVFEMKLPDLGEGVAEAEIVSWMVDVGDEVTPDSALAEVLTDKATIEVVSPVAGTVVVLHGEPGDVLAVGSTLVGIETEDDATGSRSTVAAGTQPAAATESPSFPEPDPRPASPSEAEAETETERTREWGARVTAAPAVRKRAADLGIDLGTLSGTGPGERVVHADLDRRLAGGSSSAGRRHVAPSDDRRVEPVRGVRRKIAGRLSAAWTETPHITYVEAVDVTELEALRAELNRDDDEVRLTLLPFLVRAIVVACREQPRLNAHYDHAAETLTVVDAVHAGIATQTGQGLMVPVVRHAETRHLRDLAAEIGRVTDAARNGQASRDELSGSTITITSLGALGGLATTPILNPPEVAIVGVNKMEVRPVWRDGAFQPRQVLNLSSSFDHRMVDGSDAATFVQRIKSLMEIPALLFVED
jgi:pyruvate/2-oxoglutarate/acetoin dehydrogenase E1 component/pyruvate/2-oxoglutarate dehydrogenase complex dihydrolipoamide acyltransferase (E2) component